MLDVGNEDQIHTIESAIVMLNLESKSPNTDQELCRLGLTGGVDSAQEVTGVWMDKSVISMATKNGLFVSQSEVREN